MLILEFIIVENMGKWLWKPLNHAAREFCRLMRRTNMTKDQIDSYRSLGVQIKEQVTYYSGASHD